MLCYLFLPGQMLLWVSDELFYESNIRHQVLFSCCTDTHKPLQNRSAVSVGSQSSRSPWCWRLRFVLFFLELKKPFGLEVNRLQDCKTIQTVKPSTLGPCMSLNRAAWRHIKSYLLVRESRHTLSCSISWPGLQASPPRWSQPGWQLPAPPEWSLCPGDPSKRPGAATCILGDRHCQTGAFLLLLVCICNII